MRRHVIGTLALLALLAGCGGDPKADPSPTGTATPTTTPVSTTPSAPVMPDAAKDKSKAGAIEFVKYYVAVFNHAQTTGDTGQLRTLSLATCEDCQKAIEGLEEIYRSGGKIVGGNLEPGAATVEFNPIEKRWLVLVRIDSGPQSVTTASNTTPSELPGGRRAMQFSLSRSAGTWRVSSWSRA